MPGNSYMKITENVIRLDCTRGAYAYAVIHDGVTLIDTSFPGRGRRILSELASHGISPAEIRCILLTHCDLDHIGNAAYLVSRSGCDVFIGEADLARAMRQKRAEVLKDIVSIAMRVKCPNETRTLSGNIGEIRIIPTPGHTPGHHSFLFRNVLFSGDSLSSSRNMIRAYPSRHKLNAEKVSNMLEKPELSDVEWICSAHSEILHLDAAAGNNTKRSDNIDL